MAFKPGNPGRPKGAIGTLSKYVRETAERLDVDPFEVLLYFAAGDWKSLGYDTEKYISGHDKYGVYEKWTIDPSVRCKAASDASQYVFPKLRSIEHVKADALSGMTPAQKLEAMKHAVQMLELQMKEKK